MILDEKKKREERAARFGIETTDSKAEKMKARQERFGIETTDSKADKMKARQERFGIETKESAEAKRLERMKRFGMPVSTDKNSDLAEIRAARKDRFAIIDQAGNKQKSFKKRDKKQF